MSLRLFVRGLASETTDKDLEDFLSKFAKIESITMHKSPFDNSCRGYAHFNVYSDADASKCVAAINGTNFKAKSLTCERAKDTKWVSAKPATETQAKPAPVTKPVQNPLPRPTPTSNFQKFASAPESDDTDSSSSESESEAEPQKPPVKPASVTAPVAASNDDTESSEESSDEEPTQAVNTKQGVESDESEESSDEEPQPQPQPKKTNTPITSVQSNGTKSTAFSALMMSDSGDDEQPRAAQTKPQPKPTPKAAPVVVTKPAPKPTPKKVEQKPQQQQPPQPRQKTTRQERQEQRLQLIHEQNPKLRESLPTQPPAKKMKVGDSSSGASVAWNEFEKALSNEGFSFEDIKNCNETEFNSILDGLKLSPLQRAAIKTRYKTHWLGLQKEARSITHG